MRAVEGEKGESVSFAGWAAGKLSIIHSRRQGGGLPGRLPFRRRQEPGGKNPKSEARNPKQARMTETENGRRGTDGLGLTVL